MVGRQEACQWIPHAPGEVERLIHTAQRASHGENKWSRESREEELHRAITIRALGLHRQEYRSQSSYYFPLIGPSPCLQHLLPVPES